MSPHVSIIIPARNSSFTLQPLLLSIYESKNVSLSMVEVLVVNDGSTDNTVYAAAGFAVNHPKLGIKILSLRKNKGPAHVRNYGAKFATGEILFFLDSDVVLHQYSLSHLIHAFEDPDIHALTGVWDKRQHTDNFFPRFKALRDWSYWINERDPKNYYYLFSTRVAAIRAGLFLRLKGFDETYKAALVEDIELTYRIARRYAVIFNPKVSVHHEFESFIPITKKYFWRSYFWTKIYHKRKKFDPVAATNKEAITTISAGISVCLALILTVIKISHAGLNIMSINLELLLFAFLFLSLLTHLLGVRKFLQFCYQEEGFVFMLKSFTTGFILYIVILSGAFFSYTNIYHSIEGNNHNT